MKIALVTNKKYHHKFWAYSLYKSFDVKMIIHPHQKRSFLKLLRYKVFQNGILYSFLKIISIIFKFFKNDINKHEKKYFLSYSKKYDSIPSEIIYNINSINDKEIIRLIKKNQIDVICFLGGQIAKKKFISSSKYITLNFHSGISPFYNGNKTLFNSFINRRPNFSGGTLMVMNEEIDSGNILSHYLCSIEENDNIYDLFMKTIIGSVKLYQDFINEFKKNKNINGVEQIKTFSNYKYIDWTISDDLKLINYNKKNILKNYLRKEKIIKYYNLKNEDFKILITKSLRNIFSL